MKIQVGLEEGGVAVHANERALERLERLIARGQQRGDLSRAFGTADLVSTSMSLANGTITHWLYEEAAGPLRERMCSAAEIWLGAVGAGERRDEPLPDLFGEIEWFPPVTPISRARSRRKR